MSGGQHAGRLPRFRRSATLALYWHNGGIVCENYRTKSRTGINGQGIELLEYFTEWRSRQECVKRFSEYSRTSVFRSINQMMSRGLLVRERSPEAEIDAAVEGAWAHWLPHAGFLHFGTKDEKYAETEEEIDSLIAHMQAVPRPPFSRAHAGGDPLVLRKPAGAASSFTDVLLARRTHRIFSQEALGLDQLSTLLYYTWGVTGYMDVPLLGRLPLKTSPSGGARHPGEVYVAALRVEGLKPGLYHYGSDGHSLDSISQRVSPSQVIEYCAGQQWTGDAAALFIMTAVFARTMWKYPVSRAYRVVLTEAGHLCQTFCLVASSLDLAPFCTMALKDTLIESDLGLNGVDESVLYVAGVGVPPDSQLAASIR